MAVHYSHTYEDPETGEIVDVVEYVDDEDEDEDDGDYRNARGIPRPSGGRYRPGRRPGIPRPRPRQLPARPRQLPARTRQYFAHKYPLPRPVDPADNKIAVSPGRISVPTSALTELIPAVGKVWASFLQRPDMPRATGDDIADRNDAAEHRDALASHSQSQTRILALSDLAAKALKAFTG